MQYLCGITYILALIFTVVTTMARPYDNSFRDVYETEPIFQVSIKIATHFFILVAWSASSKCFMLLNRFQNLQKEKRKKEKKKNPVEKL